jgi:CTP:molybdopterin cytidylyltransferase MocA
MNQTKMTPAPTPPLILLCAGKSERLGQPKGLYPMPDGRSWLETQLEAYAEAGLKHIVLVLGHDEEAYRAAAPWKKQNPYVQIIVNPKPEQGPFSSLQAGLDALPPGRAAFACPVDVPCPRKSIWETLTKAQANTGAWALVPAFEGHGGHPVLLGPDFVATLLKKPASSRLDEELRALKLDQIKRVSSPDPRVVQNLNTVEDFKAYSPQ